MTQLTRSPPCSKLRRLRLTFDRIKSISNPEKGCFAALKRKREKRDAHKEKEKSPSKPLSLLKIAEEKNTKSSPAATLRSARLKLLETLESKAQKALKPKKVVADSGDAVTDAGEEDRKDREHEISPRNCDFKLEALRSRTLDDGLLKPSPQTDRFTMSTTTNEQSMPHASTPLTAPTFTPSSALSQQDPKPTIPSHPHPSPPSTTHAHLRRKAHLHNSIKTRARARARASNATTFGLNPRNEAELIYRAKQLKAMWRDLWMEEYGAWVSAGRPAGGVPTWKGLRRRMKREGRVYGWRLVDCVFGDSKDGAIVKGAGVEWL